MAVDGSGDAPTIPAAIDSAAVGDTILVGPGEYPRFDLLDAGIHLLSEAGADSTFIDRGFGVWLQGTTVPTEVAGFTGWHRNSADGLPGIDARGGNLHLHHCVSTENFGNFTTGGIRLSAPGPTDQIIAEFNVAHDNAPSLSGTVSLDGNVVFRNNTIQGSDSYLITIWGGSPAVTENIFSDARLGAIECPGGELSGFDCNVFYDYRQSGDQYPDCFIEGVHGFTADPWFCGAPLPARDFRVRENSPAVLNTPCGVLIGALDVGCGTSSVDPANWGQLKAMYR